MLLLAIEARRASDTAGGSIQNEEATTRGQSEKNHIKMGFMIPIIDPNFIRESTYATSSSLPCACFH